jgi:phosphohistidine phosphatase
MALYLVQHAKAESKDVDPERGLSKEGLAEAERIAEVARGYGVRVGVIRHSGKQRATQTAIVFAAALEPERGIERFEGIGPLDDVFAFADTVDSGEDAMIVGHLPFLERLTGLLTAGSADTRVLEFQNGGVVCLDVDPHGGGWLIKWSLSPHIG